MARRTKNTSVKKRERRFRPTVSVLQTILSTITDFNYLFDREGRFVYANQALLDLWGLELKDAVGQNFVDLKYPEALAERLQRQIQEVFTNKAGVTDETLYTSPTGAGGYYEYIFRPVFDKRGNVKLVAGSTRDITERKRTEEKLRESEERLRELAGSLENQVRERTAMLEEQNKQILAQASHLQRLSVQVMNVKDSEGRRIARELHDSAGQITAALLMNLGTLAKKLKKADAAVTNLVDEAIGNAKELDRDIRTTSYLLHPPMLDEIGLSAALRWYLQGLKQRASLDVELGIPEDFGRLPAAAELTIFRIVQECVTNVHRHSGSKSARVNISREEEHVSLTVADVGRGIPASLLAKMLTEGSGVGLRGIRERIRSLNGQLCLESKPGLGTTVTVTFAINSETSSI